MTVVVIIIWWGSSFSLWSDWDAWTDGSDSISEEMSVNLNERKENDDGSVLGGVWFSYQKKSQLTHELAW